MYLWKGCRADLRLVVFCVGSDVVGPSKNRHSVVSSGAFLQCDDSAHIPQSPQYIKPRRPFGQLDSLLYQSASRVKVAVFQVAGCGFKTDPSAGDGELFGVSIHGCILVLFLRIRDQNNASWGCSITRRTGIDFASVTI